MKSTFSILTLMAAAVAMAAAAPEANPDAQPGAQPGFPPFYSLNGYYPPPTPNYDPNCNLCYNLNCYIGNVPTQPGCQYGCNNDGYGSCTNCYDDCTLVPKLWAFCYRQTDSVGYRYASTHPVPQYCYINNRPNQIFGLGGYGSPFNH